jgi:hypothetical protein
MRRRVRRDPRSSNRWSEARGERARRRRTTSCRAVHTALTWPAGAGSVAPIAQSGSYATTTSGSGDTACAVVSASSSSLRRQARAAAAAPHRSDSPRQ